MTNKKPGEVQGSGLNTFKMQCKFNKFTKKPDNKTAFVLAEGYPIFSETVYLLEPRYIHKRSPDFTLVNKGKHISGLFRIAPNTYLGDYQKKALIIFLRAEGLAFDLFQTDLAPITARQMLLNGSLNEILYKAREEASIA
jgi:hypothetical protein